jgi:HEAT repeat protein
MTEARRASAALLRTALHDPAAARECVPELVDRLASEDPRVRVNCGWAIGLVVSAHPEAVFEVVPGLIPHLSDPDCREDVARVLAYVADGYREQTRSALTETYAAVERSGAAPLLAQLDDPTADVGPEDVFVLEVLSEAGATRGHRSEAESEPDGEEPDGSDGDTPGAPGSESQSVGGDASGAGGGRRTRSEGASALFAAVTRDASFDSIEHLGTLGTGHCSTVYRALVTSGSTRQVVALKLFGESADRHGDVQRAVTAWRQIDDHRHVATVYDTGRHPRPWVAVEFAESGIEALAGDPLGRRLERGRHLVDAVSDAHSRGVLHCGLRPANVLATEPVDRDRVVPKVTDWGLPLAGSHGREAPANPRYAAPEQLDPDRYGDRDQYTDVYQLGAVLHRLFTGVPPYEGTARAVAGRVLDDDRPDPREANPDLPPRIGTVLSTALSPRKPDRYGTVDRLGAALDAAGPLEGV